MYLLYRAPSATEDSLLPAGYTLHTLSARWKNRHRLDKLDWMWHVLALGKYQKIVVSTTDGTVAHTSRVIGRCLKFPFLSKRAAEIGPCATQEAFRGQGIYPAVIRHIRAHGGYAEYYMLVHEDNHSSIRGIEKAGFEKIGHIEKRHGRWIPLN